MRTLYNADKTVKAYEHFDILLLLPVDKVYAKKTEIYEAVNHAINVNHNLSHKGADKILDFKNALS